MIAKAVWNWFFPEKIDVPDCVMDLLKFIYPTVDWDKVTFHKGWPQTLFFVTGMSAITLPSDISLDGIDVYIKSSEWKPCSCEELGTIVHEGFHVLQIQDLLGGYGLGLVRPFTQLYISCLMASGFSYDDHPLERAAYKVAGDSASAYEKCCDNSGAPLLPCDCSSGVPLLSSQGLEHFKKNCQDIVQKASGLNFWKQLALCTPGLKQIGDAAKWVWHKLCNSEIPWWLIWLTCPIGGIIAGILWLIWGICYAIWLIITFCITLIVWILKIIIEIIGNIIGVIVAMGEFIWKGIKTLWNVITSPFSSAKSWIWYTSYDGNKWQIPDISVTKNDRSKTSASPALAVYNDKLYMVYKGSDSNNIWYNVFYEGKWLDSDIEITKNGHTKTSASPALAVYNDKLYMVYKGSDSNDIWYNVFDRTNWLAEDIKISKNDSIKTKRGPALSEFLGLLFLVYRDDS